MPNIEIDDITTVAKDALYVGVGLGVIAFQKAQVRRQDLKKTLNGQASDAKDQIDTLSTFVEDRIKVVEERLSEVEDRLAQILDQVELKLPEQAADLVKQARVVAKDARGQLNQLVARNGSAA